MMYGNDLNKLFDKFFSSPTTYYSSTYRLVPIDDETEHVKDEDYEINHVKDGAYLHFEVPGFNKENLEINRSHNIRWNFNGVYSEILQRDGEKEK